MELEIVDSNGCIMSRGDPENHRPAGLGIEHHAVGEELVPVSELTPAVLAVFDEGIPFRGIAEIREGHVHELDIIHVHGEGPGVHRDDLGIPVFSDVHPCGEGIRGLTRNLQFIGTGLFGIHSNGDVLQMSVGHGKGICRQWGHCHGEVHHRGFAWVKGHTRGKRHPVSIFIGGSIGGELHAKEILNITHIGDGDEDVRHTWILVGWNDNDDVLGNAEYRMVAYIHHCV